MRIAIVYESKTGNTKKIAETIRSACSNYEVTYFGMASDAIEADLYFIGSWTDKGNCDSNIADFCQRLHHKKVAIFATCGFGGSREYQEMLYQRFISNIANDNEILGHFCCMGKMSLAIKERYVSMLQEHPEDKKLEVSIKNFEDALKHPNQKDIEDTKIFVKEVLTRC